MDQDEREGYAPPTRSEQLRKTATAWAIFAGWALFALGMFWILFNLPPEVSGFLRGVFRLLSAFS